MVKFIAYDLGTGGVKASLYDENLQTLAKSFIEYETFYPSSTHHEQRPEDWWNGVVESTRILLKESAVNPSDVKCLALSGHSLVTVPIGKDGNLLVDRVPIWSDTRPTEEVKEFFNRIDEEEWYMTTGNGFPPPCYSIFKLMWLKKHKPEIYNNIYKVLGSKDYINYKMTGKFATDYSYASGCGAYNLQTRELEIRFLNAAGLSPDIFPEIVPSHHIVGELTKEAAEILGLEEGTKVACGGVDNACMALGEVGPEDGKVYTSLGSSSWIAVNSSTPILDFKKKPYVFAHIEEGKYTSAFSIFSGGNSFRWVRDTLCPDLKTYENPYDKMTELAKTSPIGSNGIIFNPSLAGGTSQDKSINIRGAYIGLHLGVTRADLIRAAMEGIALNLRISLDNLKEHTQLTDELLFCGGGSKNEFWMQMFADIFQMKIIKTNIDQDAASVGAAAVAARAYGLWKDYMPIYQLHHVEHESIPNKDNIEEYEKLLTIFKHISDVLADVGDFMMKERERELVSV